MGYEEYFINATVTNINSKKTVVAVCLNALETGCTRVTKSDGTLLKKDSNA